ncbi:MAG: methylmalonyl-CoA epimerase [Bacteroidota bacterium]
MTKLEHIGIAVKDLQQSISLFETLLNSNCYKTETVESEQVTTAFFKQGDTKIELLANTAAGGVIEKFIDKKGEGIHHLAFAVTDIRSEMKRLKDQGFILLQEEPKKGADNKWVCFLHPKSTNGVLIELCEDID